jgi:WD40 repeat protein/transcriptional regulator with XRE-family HTH domain
MKSFSEALEELRRSRQMSKKDLAYKANLTPSYISQLTRGERTTPSEEVVNSLSEALNLDKESRLSLLKAAGYSSTSSSDLSIFSSKRVSRREDLGETPSAQVFHGRQDELATLQKWIREQNCQIALIQGIGGIGKTALTAAFTNQVKDQFEFVFWRSLINAPPLENILRPCIQLISNQSRVDLPESVDDQITLLIEYLNQYRCLLILDNAEIILKAEQQVGQYRDSYSDYGKFIQRIGTTQHQSCLILTSREKPRDIAHMEGQKSSVRTLHLSGVGLLEGREILKDKGLTGSDRSWAALINSYSGNPLALKLVSEFVQDVFNGDIDSFLNEEEIMFSDINNLVNEQFHRLSVPEREILYWLVIEREPVTLENLRENLTPQLTKGIFIESIASLRRRSMIETRDPALFTLQPVIMEYVTSDLVRRAWKEFDRELDADSNNVWLDFSFIKAQTKDYVRDSQERLILAPIAAHLITAHGKAGIEQKLKNALSALRQLYHQPRSYFAGNVLNLLIYLQSDLRSYDFSNLMIRQAYLQNAYLPEVNFFQANFAASVFTNTFGNILSLAFSSTEDKLAAGTATGRICIYNALTGNLLFNCDGHTDGVWSVSFNASGDIIASCSDDGTIRFWDASTGECFKTLRGHADRVRSIDFDVTGNILASGSDDGTIRLWNIRTGDCLNTLQGHTDRVWAVVFSPEGNKLASGSTDQTIRLWDVTSGSCFRLLEGHTDWIRSLVFSPNGHTLVSGSDDGTLRLWDVTIGNCIKVLQGHTNRVWCVAFSPDGSTIASGSEDSFIRLWDLNTGHCFRVQQGHTQGVRSVSFNFDGSMLASGGDDQTIRLWDLNTGHCLRSLQGYTNRLWSVKFSRDGHQLVSCGEDQIIRLWDISLSQCFKTLPTRNQGVRDIDFSSDGSMLASGGEDHSIRLWDVTSGDCLKILLGHTNWLRTVAFSPDGSMLASGGEDHSIRLWDVTSGDCLKILSGHTNWLRTVAFHPQGNILASGGDDQTIRLWDVSGGNCSSILKGHAKRVRSVAFHPQGNVLASGGEDNDIYLWDMNTNQHFKTLSSHTNWVLSIAFSPDGAVLASGSDDQTIRLWDVNTGTCVKVLQGHSRRIRRVDFHPEGSMLASCSDDGTIKLWNVQTGDCLKTLIGERPYEHMNISNVRGLSLAQKDMLVMLGAIEN